MLGAAHADSALGTHDVGIAPGCSTRTATIKRPGMITGAEAMTLYAKQERVDFAILMDMSGACATQVILDGSRFIEDRSYRMGVGVAAASLTRAGSPVVSQHDFRTLETLWYRRNFGVDGS